MSNLETLMNCSLNKRKRAVSVDNLNEQKDDLLLSENSNENSKTISYFFAYLFSLIIM